jgi:hypothetical protein
VARGLAPVRLRSSRKLGKCGVVKYALGPLRDPTGASPPRHKSPSIYRTYQTPFNIAARF